MGNIQDQLQNLSSENTKQKISNIPSKANLFQFPKTIRDGVLTIQAYPINLKTNATIIIGTISKGYNKNMFEADVNRICKIFKLDPKNSKQVLKIDLNPIEGVFDNTTDLNQTKMSDTKEASENNNVESPVEINIDKKENSDFTDTTENQIPSTMPDIFKNFKIKMDEEAINDNLQKVLDSEDARDKITKAVEIIAMGRYAKKYDPNDPSKVLNEYSEFGVGSGEKHTKYYSGLYMLRIVSVGVGYTEFLFEALEFLLKEWRQPVEEKNVQFIIRNDTVNRRFINFWEDACIKKLCQYVQYVNLSKYLPFGYYKNENDIEKK